ncbi:MAG TPA: sigma-70 family RNA polymerase sigma factor [Mycobacteriales bacterium]|nr:sigma-70 family RNA polymerase sigma factor [Mycobacteriales bacterium]
MRPAAGPRRFTSSSRLRAALRCDWGAFHAPAGRNAPMSPHDTQCPATSRDDLINQHLGLAYGLAARFGGRGSAPMQDLRQVAAEALVKAAHSYDPERGIPFAGYATPTILGMLKRYFRDNTWGVHVPRSMQERSLAIGRAREELSQQLQRSPTPKDLAEYMKLPLDEVISGIEAAAGYRSMPLDLPQGREPATGADADPMIELAENVQALRPLLADLPERDRQMLAMRFGEEMTQSQIAERIGVSQMQVSRLLNQCLGQLRHRLLAVP